MDVTVYYEEDENIFNYYFVTETQGSPSIFQKGEEVVREALPEEYHPAVPEISVYLVESVGNSTRIDYGTGHELAFIMFLVCIFKIGALKQEDSTAAVIKLFSRYSISIV